MRKTWVVVTTDLTQARWLIWPFVSWPGRGQGVCCLLKQESRAASYAVRLRK